MHRISTGCTSTVARLALAGVVCLALVAGSAAPAAASAVLLRLFLTDGTSVVSYGEYARVEDQVVFSTPVGGSDDATRLQVVSIPASSVDWDRTEAYGASARHQRYATTRGEADFDRLERDVAAVLNQIAVSTAPAEALALAERARVALAAWPAAHYGYRADDVRDFLMIIDEAVSSLRARTGSAYGEHDDLAVTFSGGLADVALEPALGMPTLPEQLDHALNIAGLTARADDRVAVLQAALLIVDDLEGVLPARELALARATTRQRIDYEQDMDRRYATLSRDLLREATAAAESARIGDVERVLASIPERDAALGGARPYLVRALQTSVRDQLDTARRERLRQDQWAVRRGAHDEYQRIAGGMIQNLVSMKPSFDAIRRLDGPSPDALLLLQRQLRGGAARMELMVPPALAQGSHDLLVAAWRFAETAVNTRYEAAGSGDVDTAWRASSAAAGALSLLEQAEAELQALVEPPPRQ
jgi:hypothetical protein